MYILLGARAENGDTQFLENPSSEEEIFLFSQIRKRIKNNPGRFVKQRDEILGVSEETTTGVHRLYQLMEKESCHFQL